MSNYYVVSNYYDNYLSHNYYEIMNKYFEGRYVASAAASALEECPDDGIWRTLRRIVSSGHTMHPPQYSYITVAGSEPRRLHAHSQIRSVSLQREPEQRRFRD